MWKLSEKLQVQIINRYIKTLTQLYRSARRANVSDWGGHMNLETSFDASNMRKFKENDSLLTFAMQTLAFFLMKTEHIIKVTLQDQENVQWDQYRTFVRQKYPVEWRE